MKWKFRRIIEELLRLHNSPHDIALGTARGVFIAILRVYVLHTGLVIIAALLIRPANKIAILLGTNISLPPTVPFITWAGYGIGRFLFKGDLPLLMWSDFKNITFQKIAKFYPPLFLGSLILGIICAAVFYFLTFFIARRLKSRRRHAS